MYLNATEGRVIVRRDAATTKTKGGIIIPETAKERPVEGVVLHVGPGEYLESGDRKLPPCEIGDRVLFGKYAGTEYVFETAPDEVLQILTYIEILAVIRE